MHELSICQALITQVEDMMRERSGRVQHIHICVGPLSGVEPKLLEDAYPLASAGTCAEGSRLSVEPTNVKVRCCVCGTESEAAPNRLLCGACGDWRTELLSGDELLLLRIEFEEQGNAMELANV